LIALSPPPVILAGYHPPWGGARIDPPQARGIGDVALRIASIVTTARSIDIMSSNAGMATISFDFSFLTQHDALKSVDHMSVSWSDPLRSKTGRRLSQESPGNSTDITKHDCSARENDVGLSFANPIPSMTTGGIKSD
jgi:hypothetical protein